MGKFLMQEQLGQAAIVTYRNPPQNVWTLEAVDELSAAVTALGARRDIRALVLTGAGDTHFSGGSDGAALIAGGRGYAERWVDAWGRALEALERYPGVTVAALNGTALGVGLACALACDYLVAERELVLAMPDARLGLVPLAGTTRWGWPGPSASCSAAKSWTPSWPVVSAWSRSWSIPASPRSSDSVWRARWRIRAHRPLPRRASCCAEPVRRRWRSRGSASARFFCVWRRGKRRARVSPPPRPDVRRPGFWTRIENGAAGA